MSDVACTPLSHPGWQVLPDLLAEMDALPLSERLLATVEGVLAANIFDWGGSCSASLLGKGMTRQIRPGQVKSKGYWGF